MGISRRSFLKSSALAAAGASVSAPLFNCLAASSENKPNILFILADDVGYGDLGYMGHPTLKTPNIDSWSSSGMRFSQFYAASCTCTPTRISCFTGRYPLVYGCEYAFMKSSQGLPHNCHTVANILKAGGYATGFVGKWHMGGNYPVHIKARLAGNKSAFPGPNDLGFDDAYFWDEGGCFHSSTVGSNQYSKGPACIVYNDKPLDPPADENLIATNTENALSLIDKYASGSKPFYIQLWYYAAHKSKTGYDNLPECGSQYEGDPKKDYYALIDCMDKGIGQLRQKLDSLGIADNTLIFFTSDNGPIGPGDSGGLRGGKLNVWEGGIRVPAFAVWPGKIESGSASDAVGITNDLLPTFCDAADVTLPADGNFDGITLLPHLTSKESVGKRTLYFYRSAHATNLDRAVREGDWKLCINNGVPVGLYNLAEDKFETKNHMDEYPEMVTELAAKMDFFVNNPKEVWRERPVNAGRYNGQYSAAQKELPLKVRANKNGSLSFYLHSNQTLSFDFLTCSGRTLFAVPQRRFSAGSHTIHAGKRLGKGSFLLRVKANGKTSLYRFSSVR